MTPPRRARLVKSFLVALSAVGLLAVVLVGTAFVRYDRQWDVPVPLVSASSDPERIERGRYIVYGPGRCADCHTPDEARATLARGGEAPLTGGPGEVTYLGTWTAPNLTPDRATGLGAVSDAAIARMLRFGVDRFGHIALPFMDAYKDLTDDDVAAIVAFLRSTAPRSGVAPEARVNFIGKIALAFFITPYAPAEPPRPSLTPEPTASYGAYVAGALAGCGACHTSRNLRTGAYLSPMFSGGLAFKARQHPGEVYVSPNLTPDPETGRIAAWTEDQFVARFRAGLILADSPMPWGGFSRMTDTDLRALYRYLRSLPPARHAVGPIRQPEHGSSAG